MRSLLARVGIVTLAASLLLCALAGPAATAAQTGRGDPNDKTYKMVAGRTARARDWRDRSLRFSKHLEIERKGGGKEEGDAAAGVCRARPGPARTAIRAFGPRTTR